MELILDGLNYRVTWEQDEGSFERKEKALTQALADLDRDWATQIAGALSSLEAGILAGSDAFLTNLRLVSAGLRTQIALRDEVGVVTHGLVWSEAITNSFQFQASLHATILLGLGLPDLAAQFRYFALERPQDYLDDVVIPALMEMAEKNLSTIDLGLRLEGLTASQKEVGRAPRTTTGNRRAYVVRVGDSLKDVADAIYQEEGHEGDLILSRGLQPPFVSETRRSGCIVPGDRILRPSSIIPGNDDNVLGATFALHVSSDDGGQNWDILPLPGGGIDYASGVDCLVTDAALRLATPLGTLQGEVRYGYPQIIGLPLSEQGVVGLALAAETLLEDDRIESVHPRMLAPLTERGVAFQELVIIPKRK